MATSQRYDIHLPSTLGERPRRARQPFNREAAVTALGIAALVVVALVYLWLATR